MELFMSFLNTKLKRSLISVAAFLLVIGVGILLYSKVYLPHVAAVKSFPVIDGELQIKGLNDSVSIYRDQMGITHIYASNEHDLFFAQGFVHAQDRFWQMDFWRHVGAGSLAEMFGKGTLATDQFIRTLGWRDVAEKEYAGLSEESKALLQSYADGVNAYIQDRSPVELSLEYAILKGIMNRGYVIEPWTPIHSLTWGKAMAWDLGGNMSTEITRAVLLKTLSTEQLAELYPDYPQENPVIVPTIGNNVAANEPVTAHSVVSNIDYQKVIERIDSMKDLLGELGTDIGSNSWVVGGSRTTTGKPLIANDMHLGIQMPSIWYQNSLHCTVKSPKCRFNVTGYSFAGVPGVVVGHNDQIAWAFTNLGPDVQDLFIEKINPTNPNQYEVNGSWVDFDTRKEIIKIAGGETVELTVRISRHGPIISDSYGPLMDHNGVSFKDRAGDQFTIPENYAIALSWTALSPSTPFEAIWGFNLAQNWNEFRNAARNFHVPAQNLAYADINGNIGYQAPGDVPIRKKGDGSLPVPGWNSEYDWAGFISFNDMPYTYNPRSDYIVTANNQSNPRSYNRLITTDWDYGYRARRIVDMIEQAPAKIDAEYIRSMHGDSKSLNAKRLVPILLQIEMKDNLAKIRDKHFANWDFQQSADSSAAVLFEAFWVSLLHETFADDLPADQMPDGGSRFFTVMSQLVDQPNSWWWDDKTTDDIVETRDDILIRAFTKALRCADCISKFGSNIDNWKWGDLHFATFRNQSLGKSGIGLIESLFNRGPYPVSGGKSIVNATGWDIKKGFEVNWLPSEREIVDLSDFNESVALHTTGQSGHAYHKHYDDMAPLWANIEYVPMWWNKESIEADAEGHLKLNPK